MALKDLLFQLQDSAPAQLISKSDHLVGAALQVVHILSFVALLAALLVLGLRLSGALFARQPLLLVTREVGPLLWWALSAAVVSGLLMFIASPVMYADKPAFIAKLLTFLLALLTQWLLFGPLLRRPEQAARGARPVVALSLLLWFGVAVAGRAVGFT
jgi:hypothetical protein